MQFIKRYIVISLALVSSVFAADVTYLGSASFPTTTNYSVTQLKRELFHSAYVDMINKSLAANKKDAVVFWKDFEEKIAPFLSLKREEIEKKYGKGTPKWETSQDEFKDEYRHAELIERRNFMGVDDTYKNVTIKQYTSAPSPRMEISAIVSDNDLEKLYREVTAKIKKATWEKLVIELNGELTGYSEVSTALYGEMVRWLKNNWETYFKEIIPADHSVKLKMESLMERSPEETVGDAGDFSSTLLLKITYSAKGNMLVGQVAIVNLPTQEILATGEFGPEKRKDQANLLPVLYRLPQQLLLSMKKNLKPEMVAVQIHPLKIIGVKSVLDVNKIIETIRIKGQNYSARPELRSIKGQDANILIYNQTNWSTLEQDIGAKDGILSADIVKN